MSRTTALGLAALLALTACPSAHRDLLREAELAEARGDVVSAAFAYQNSCNLERSDTESCEKAAALKAKALTRLTADARAALAARDVPAAVAALDPAYRLSQEAEVTALVEQTGALQAELCGTQAPGELEAAVLRVRCLERQAQGIPLASYRGRITEARHGAAALAASLARTNAAAHRTGAAYSLESVALCLASDPQVATARTQDYADFMARTRFPLALSVADLKLGLNAPAVCPRLQGQLPQAVVCTPTGAAENACRLSVSVQSAPVKHQSVQNVRELRYLSGTETYANPAFSQAALEERMANQSLSTLESQYAIARSDCEVDDAALSRANSCYDCLPRTNRERSCGRQTVAASELNRQQDLHNQTVNTLNNTPQLLTRDVYDTFRYTETQHHWSMPFAIHVAASGLVSRDVDDQDQIVFDAVEHAGFAPAGLEPAPRRDPEPVAYAQAVQARLEQRLAQLAHEESTARSTEAQAKCGTAGADWMNAWLECHSTGAFLAGADPGHALLEELASRNERSAQAAGLPPLVCVQ